MNFEIDKDGFMVPVIKNKAGRRIPWKESKPRSPETRRIQSEAHKGEKAYWFGKQLPESVRRKMGEARRGENNHKAKLTENEVREIKTALANGENVTALAIKFGVSYWNISDIKRNRRWSHVEVTV